MRAIIVLFVEITMQVDTITAAYGSHQIYLERLSAQFGNDVDPYIENINYRVSKLMNKLPMRALTPKEQAEYTRNIELILKEELTAFTVEIKANHREMALNEAQFAGSTLNQVILDKDFESVIPAAAQINSLATKTPFTIGEGVYTTYNKMLTDFTSKQLGFVDGIVRNGFASGLTNKEIAKLIESDIALRMVKAKTDAKAIARTGTNHYATQAKIAFVDDNEDVLIGFRSIATLDSRTSNQCKYWDQKVRSKKDKDWNKFVTPRHINERSSLVMEVDSKYKYDDSKSERPSNFKDADTGKLDPKRVSSKKDYYQEMSKLDAKSQDLALGSPTLGRAFREMQKNGDVDKFERQLLDSLYQPLSISDMKKKDNELARILNKQAK